MSAKTEQNLSASVRNHLQSLGQVYNALEKDTFVLTVVDSYLVSVVGETVVVDGIVLDCFETFVEHMEELCKTS